MQVWHPLLISVAASLCVLWSTSSLTLPGQQKLRQMLLHAEQELHEDMEEFKGRLCSYASQCRLFGDHGSAHVLKKLFLHGLLDQNIRVKVCSR